MRIFLVTSKLDLETGGGSNSDLDLKARAFIELGHDVTVVTAFSGSNKISFTPPYRLIEERIPSRGLVGIQWGALRLFRKYASEADVYYFDGHNFLYGAGLYRRLGGRVPVVSFFNRELTSWMDDSERFVDMPRSRLFARAKMRIRFLLEKYIGMPLANGIDLHTFTSPAYRSLYEHFGLRMRKEPLVVGDLFDYESVVKEYAVVAEVLPERQQRVGPLTLFFSGRLVAMRGVDLLLKAFSELENMGNFRLVICGTGPEEKTLKELAEKLRVTKYVQFAGWLGRGAIYHNLRSADIFVMPKGNGATSVALLEAMAFGLPSVVPEDNALEWVAGKAARTFKENDHHALAQGIEKLAEDPKLRETLTKRCFIRLSELNYRHTAKRIEMAMRELTTAARLVRSS